MPDGVIAKPRASRLKAGCPSWSRLANREYWFTDRRVVAKQRGSFSIARCFFVDTEGGATEPEYREKLRAASGVYWGRTKAPIHSTW